MIEAAGLTKEFRARRGRVTAVAGVDFRIEEGEFVGYAGPNGAGKSTTVKMMTGILVPTAGSLAVDGLVPWRQRRALAARTGVVFGQRTSLWWDLPLSASFDLVRHLYRVPEAEHRRRLDTLVELLGLGPLLDVPVRTLSLGQRMRAELAAAVLPAPRILFLDEPTIGLDVEAKAIVRDFLADLNANEGTTVILTTHDVDDLVRLCRRLLVIDHGRLIHDGPMADVATLFGGHRVLVLDLVENGAVVAPGATVVRSEGRRRWLEFAPEEVSAPELIARVLAHHEVRDLTLEEPDIEEVVRQIYRGGLSQRTPRPRSSGAGPGGAGGDPPRTGS
ncbi:ATP-binding cassette domain-containing protein [soil metagenome]